MTESFRISCVIQASPKRVYEAWLSSDEHSAFTGGIAEIEPIIGGSFSAWDGYITGSTIALVAHSKIVQAWRTTDFPRSANDSKLEISLLPSGKNTELVLEHSHIPEGLGKELEQGWLDYYFKPMSEYFEDEDKGI
jgi:activator of HSP90 ATPase